MSKRIYRGDEVQGDWRAAVSGDVPRETLRLSNNPRAQAAYCRERERGYADGFAQGKKEGYEAGYEDGRTAATEQYEKLLRDLALELQEVARRLEDGVVCFWTAAEHDLRELAVAIAQKLLKKQLEVSPETILHIVRDAVLRVANSSEVRIRVSTSDLPTLRAAEQELRELLPADGRIELTSDDTLPGGCLVESARGVVDATVETQLQQVRAALLEDAA